jgi:hypothetical protein
MQLTLKDNLPYITLTLNYKGTVVSIPDVLIDTGSASSIFSADILISVQIEPSPTDTLHTIRGVGGTEVVFTRRVDYLQVEDQSVPNFEVEVGGMDYGFEINGILGMDFLTAAGAILNLHDMEIKFKN